MDNWDFLRELQKEYPFTLSVLDDVRVLTNPSTGGRIEIIEERSCSAAQRTETFTEYIVCFSTQHRHLEELDEVEDYVRQILADDVLPIEFYARGQRCWGGEIQRADLAGLDTARLSALFGYPKEDLSRFEYEIHSWSGKFDVPRRQA